MQPRGVHNVERTFRMLVRLWLTLVSIGSINIVCVCLSCFKVICCWHITCQSHLVAVACSPTADVLHQTFLRATAFCIWSWLNKKNCKGCTLSTSGLLVTSVVAQSSKHQLRSADVISCMLYCSVLADIRFSFFPFLVV